MDGSVSISDHLFRLTWLWTNAWCYLNPISHAPIISRKTKALTAQGHSRRSSVQNLRIFYIRVASNLVSINGLAAHNFLLDTNQLLEGGSSVRCNRLTGKLALPPMDTTGPPLILVLCSRHDLDDISSHETQITLRLSLVIV